jgi:hypothetical protein
MARGFPARFRRTDGPLQNSKINEEVELMKHRIVLLVLSVLMLSFTAYAKERVIVLTDIENEPDDTQSMIRFLTYSNNWDVEALIATTSIHLRDKTAAASIRTLIEAYSKVRGNLLKHEAGFPTADYLLSVLREGRAAYGMSGVGAGMDSPGSEMIIRTVDRDDPRPVWVTVWGGPNCLAQALWKVSMTRSPDDLSKFVSRLRVYTISDQDDSGPWIRKTFPHLFYITSPGTQARGAYGRATWSGISGDSLGGRNQGADFTIVDNPWLDVNVRSKGPLGALYPITKFIMEGDTPSFLYLINNGLGDPEHPDWGSWGGRYELYTPRLRKWHPEQETRPIWTDAEDEVRGVDGKSYVTNKATIWRWRSAYQNDFSARMDWTIKSFAEANHPPVAKLDHPNRLIARSGERVTLSAKGSTDPDGNAIISQWFYYDEASTMVLPRGATSFKIEDANQVSSWFTAPEVTKPATMHVILAVTDQGSPALTRYQRVIVTILP